MDDLNITKTPEPAAINILLADDDKDDRFLFEKALSEISIPTQLTKVNNGEQLLTHFSGSGKLPDVLFLDLNMPLKNGYECVAKIKDNEKTRQVPVVMYSTTINDTLADVLYDQGTHYYMHKCDFTGLVKDIQRILELLSKNPAQPPRDEFVVNFRKVLG
jgi:CheY-like chemotaxis protein